eukprot:Mrub_00856.p1 GENE.Mrub_00856~~Mrub_00856.p1  ORF type:complete len:866 (+),score=104.99 Mrub_00856:146-2599(+)
MVQLDNGNALLNLGNACFDHFDHVYDVKSTSYLSCFMSLKMKEIDILKHANSNEINRYLEARTYSKQDYYLDLILSEIDSIIQDQSLKIPAFVCFRFDWITDTEYKVYIDLNIKIGNEHIYLTQPYELNDMTDAKLYKIIKSIYENIEFYFSILDNAYLHTKLEKLDEVSKNILGENSKLKGSDNVASSKPIGAFDIDDKILNANEFSELMKSLFRETTSPILKELITRKHKASKNRGGSIYNKLMSELNLCIKNRRVVLYSFLNVTSQGNNYKLGYSCYKDKLNNAVNKAVDLNRSDDYYYGFFKYISDKLLDLIRSETNNSEHKKITELYHECVQILDKVYNIHNVEYLSIWVGNKIEYLNSIYNKNTLIDEYLLRRSEYSEYDTANMIISELDLVINQKRLMIPIFCTLTSDNKGKKHKILFNQLNGDEKYQKSCTYDLETLDQNKLYYIMKNIYTYLENNYKNIDKNLLIDKIIQFEDKFRPAESSEFNTNINPHMDMDDDDESVCILEYDIDEEFVKYNSKTNPTLINLMKEGTSDLVKELATRSLRVTESKSIDKMLISELKTILNSGRLILYNFLEINYIDGLYSLGYNIPNENGFYKGLDINRSNDYYYGLFRHFNTSLLAKLDKMADNYTINEIQRLVRSCYTLLDSKHDMNSNDYLLNFVSLNSEYLAFLKSKNNDFVNEYLERRKLLSNPEWDTIICSELDFMMKEGRIVIPVFLTLCAENKHTNSGGNKFILMHRCDNTKFSKSCSYDIDNLNKENLWEMVKSIYEYIEDKYKSMGNNTDIKEKIQKIEDSIKKRSRKDRNSRNY